MTDNVSIPNGEIRGTGVVRDEHGNIKARFEFGGPATVEQAEQLKELVNIQPTN